MARFLVLLLLTSVASASADDADRFAKWEPAIRKFEELDADSPPARGAVLFTGSSSTRRWDLEKSFPELDVINRGFGGSQIDEVTHFADRIVFPYAPRTIVLYAGDNDIAKGKSPERVHGDFRKFVEVVRSKLPRTKIVFIAIKPSLKRWGLVDKVRRANALVAADCATRDGLEFVDVDAPMIGDDGRPRAELFVDDGLHLSPAGYALWTKLVAPHVTLSED